MAQPQKLCFIASYPRSGNTWVRVFLFRLMQETGAIDPAQPLTNLNAWLPWDIQATHVERAMGKPIAFATDLEMARVRPGVHRLLAMSSRVTPLVVKTHAFLGAQDGVPTIDTASYGAAVYLVRNPLDILPSLAKHLRKSLDDACATMLNKSKSDAHANAVASEPWFDWSLNVQSWTETGVPRLLVAKYEDLKANPKQMMGRIARQFGMSPSDDQISRAVEATSLERLQDAVATGEVKLSRNKEFFGGGTDRPYQEKISPDHARRLILAHARLMRVHGYLDEAALHFAGVTADEADAAMEPAA